MVKCKKCQSENIVKNGKVRGKQRYLCKDCRYNFVEGDAYECQRKSEPGADEILSQKR